MGSQLGVVEELMTCAHDEATSTTYSSEHGCQSDISPHDCDSNAIFGDDSMAHGRFGIDCPCSGLLGGCDVWLIPSSAVSGKLMKQMGLNANSVQQNVPNGQTEVYFKKNSNVVVAFHQSRTGFQLMQCIDSWDSDSSIDDSTWLIPDEWGPCNNYTKP